MKAAVQLGQEQARWLARARPRAYFNHDRTVDKHPHTGRVLRTVRHAFAANVLGRWIWEKASEAMLDAFCYGNGREHRSISRGVAFLVDWPSEGDRWLLSEPLNLLRCEE